MNTLQTIETRLAKKTAGLVGDQKKIENLNAQITQYSNSIEKLEAGLPQKQAEVDTLTELQTEAVESIRRYDVLGTEMESIRAYYDQFVWTPEQPWEEKLESSVEYKKKLAEREQIMARLTEIEKVANKTYYRR
jgi:multidrug resistance efflux pump